MKNKEVKTVYNKDNVALILQMKVDSLKKEMESDDDLSEEFGAAVAQLEIDGKVTREDILATQEHKLSGGDIMDILMHLDPNKVSGLTWFQARQTAQRIQPIYIDYHMAQGRTDANNMFTESMKAYEQAINEIYEGIYDTAKLAVLNALPLFDLRWDHKLGAAVYHKIF